jgi:hypothetical protein
MRDVQAKRTITHCNEDDVLRFEIGTPPKWREKILHPKTRVRSLAEKEGTKVRLLGGIHKRFCE